MALRTYKCPTCGAIRKTFKKDPICYHVQDPTSSENFQSDTLGHGELFSTMEVVLEAPEAKFMEPRDHLAKEKGKSRVKGLDRVLKERARNHNRETVLDDAIKNSPDIKTAIAAGWLNPVTGRRRTKIEDK